MIRRVLASAPLAAVLSVLLTAGDQPAVPLELQAELLARVLRYDRNFPLHTGPTGVVVLVAALDEASSDAGARQVVAALQQQPTLGGFVPHVELVRFTTPEALAAAAKARGADVVVFAPGVTAFAAKLGAAFAGLDVITVSTTPEGVKEGVVLGFDLVAGKPRMLINLAQARRQRADFRAEVLQLMTVVP